MDDILKQIFEAHGQKFDQGFGSDYGENSGRARKDGNDGFYGSFTGKRKGEDLYASITISLEEAAFGAKKVIRVQNRDGNMQSLEVSIPAGIESGKRIRLKGKGMAAPQGGEAGDLLLEVKVLDKPGFRREGMDVYSTVSIPFATAVLGGEAEFATLYGNVSCKIAAGTQSGSLIRLKGKGIVSMEHSNVRGDQYVTVEIQVPRDLSTAAKQKLEEFQRECDAGSRRGGHSWHAA